MKFIKSNNMSKPPIVPVADDMDGEAQPPLIVDFMLIVRDVSGIDAETFTAEVDLEMVYFWVDPRLIGQTQDEIDWSETWHPQPFISNGESIDMRDPDCVIQDPNTGLIKATSVIWGKVRNRMDLIDFPFDCDSVEVNFDFQKQGLPDGQCILRVASHADGPGGMFFAGTPPAKKCLLLDLQYSALSCWKVCGFGLHEWKKTYNQTFAQVVFRTYIQRFPFFYMTKIVLLLAMSSAMGLGAYVYPVEDVGDRLSYILGVFLANAALLFVAMEGLPKVGYLTCIDKITIASFGVAFLVGLHSFIAWGLGHGAEGDQIASIVLSVLYVLMLAGLLLPPWLRHRAFNAVLEDPKSHLDTSHPLFNSATNGLRELPLVRDHVFFSGSQTVKDSASDDTKNMNLVKSYISEIGDDDGAAGPQEGETRMHQENLHPPSFMQTS